MNYLEVMRELGELRQRRRRQRVAPCSTTRHARWVATQNTRIRQRLGAEIDRIATVQGFTTQEALAQQALVSLRTIVAVQRGDKVSAKTMRKIEIALNLPTGATDDFLEGKINSLEPEEPPTPGQRTGLPTSEPEDLRDDVERKFWAIDELSESERWTYIYQYRARKQAEGKAKAS